MRKSQKKKKVIYKENRVNKIYLNGLEIRRMVFADDDEMEQSERFMNNYLNNGHILKEMRSAVTAKKKCSSKK